MRKAFLSIVAGSVWCGIASGAGAPASEDPESPHVKIFRVPDNGIQPVAQADAEGAVHLVFFRGDPAHGDLYYTLRARGAAECDEPIRVNTHNGSAIAIGTIRGAQLALGQAGRVHVAWMGSSKTAPDGDPHRAPMLYTRSTATGEGLRFEPERNVITEAYGLDGGGAVAADDSGRVEIYWHAGEPAPGEPARQVWVARSDNDGETFARETAAWDVPTGVCGCCGMTAGMSGKRSWVLYRSATEGTHRDIYLLQSEAAGGAFSGERLDRWNIASCPMSSMSLSFASERTAAAWEASDGGLGFTIVGTAVRGAVPKGGAVRKYPSIALAPDGRFLLAWVDGAGWNIGGRVAWRRFSTNGEPVEAPQLAGESRVWNKPAAVYDGESFVVIY